MIFKLPNQCIVLFKNHEISTHNFSSKTQVKKSISKTFGPHERFKWFEMLRNGYKRLQMVNNLKGYTVPKKVPQIK